MGPSQGPDVAGVTEQLLTRFDHSNLHLLLVLIPLTVAAAAAGAAKVNLPQQYCLVVRSTG